MEGGKGGKREGEKRVRMWAEKERELEAREGKGGRKKISRRHGKRKLHTMC